MEEIGASSEKARLENSGRPLLPWKAADEQQKIMLALSSGQSRTGQGAKGPETIEAPLMN